MEIRQYEPADHEQVLDLHEEALRDAGGYVEGAPEPDLNDIPGTYLASGDFLVGERDGDLVAMCAVRPVEEFLADQLADVSDTTGELKRLRVHPSVQHQGLGTEIYSAVETSAKKAGFTELVLDTTPAQQAARQFFESQEFALAGETTVEADTETFDLLFYRKPLE